MKKSLFFVIHLGFFVLFLMGMPCLTIASEDNDPNDVIVANIEKNGLRYEVHQYAGSDLFRVNVFISEEADLEQKVPSKLKVEAYVTYNKQKYPVTYVGGLNGEYAKKVVTSIELPNTIQEIGVFACYGMRNLKTVKYNYKNGQLLWIGKYAFENCVSLVEAPYATSTCPGNTLAVVEANAFANCKGLTAFSFPETIALIEYGAFKGSGLRTVNFPTKCPDLQTLNGFDECPYLREVHVPEGVKILGELCFSSSGITEIWLPGTLREIGEYCFYECSQLRQLHPRYQWNMLRVGANAFSYCENLVKVDDCNEETFDDCNFTPCYIGKSAFSYCKSLVSKNFISNCDSIEAEAFKGCSSLPKVFIWGSYVGSSAFEDCSSIRELYCHAKYIGKKAFRGCISLESVSLKRTEYIGAGAFITYDYKRGSASLRSVTGLTPKIEFGSSSLSGIFDYAKSGSRPNNGCFYKEFEDSYQYNILKTVKPAIQEWEKKKEYEKTSQWEQRVTEANRDKEVMRLIDMARTDYIKKYAPQQGTYQLGKYDSDAEVYSFSMNECKSIVYVKVPLAEAQMFKTKFESASFQPQFCIKEDKIDLASCKVTINGKQYVSPTIYHDDETAMVDLKLSPLQINLSTTKPKANLAQAPAKKSEVDTNIPNGNNVSNNLFVIIIGNENYSDPSVSTASFAQNDANIFEQYCLKTLGVPQKNIHKKLDATRNQIRSEMKWFSGIEDAFGQEAELIFYYSGHGMPDEKVQKTYLLPSDGIANDPESAYALTTLYAQLGEMDVKRVSVFLDACFSGSQRNGGMLTASKGVAIKVKADAPSGKMVVFSAASGDETAYPNNEEGHGMFTYYLLKKLQETKGDVTLQNLGEYITTNVRQQSIVQNNKSQTPTTTASSTLGDSWKNWKLK